MKKSTNLIDYEHHDDAGMISDHRKDLSAEKHNQRVAMIELMRAEWAAINGNDSGFDPYAEYEYQD